MPSQTSKGGSDLIRGGRPVILFVGDVGRPDLLESAATINVNKALGLKGFRNFVPKDAFTCYGYFFVKRDHGPLTDGAASFNTRAGGSP